MSKGKQSDDSVFNIGRIREIVELMEQHELTEIDLQQGDDRIKLKSGGAQGIMMPPMPMAAAQAPSAPAPTAVASAPPAASVENDNTITINAPSIGTFYAKANPEAEPFVQVGQMVTPDTIVCIIEAMKVFNEIPAECSGKIVEVLVEDQQSVDFGKPMFRVQPNR